MLSPPSILTICVLDNDVMKSWVNIIHQVFVSVYAKRKSATQKCVGGYKQEKSYTLRETKCIDLSPATGT